MSAAYRLNGTYMLPVYCCQGNVALVTQFTAAVLCKTLVSTLTFVKRGISLMNETKVC